jgi:hypothetical protein
MSAEYAVKTYSAKILPDVEISAPGEIPATVEILVELEKQAAHLLFKGPVA